MKTFNVDRLNGIMEGLKSRRYIHGAVFKVSTADGNQTWCGAVGNMQRDSRYYIASINKLVVSALTLRLIAGGRLSLDDTLARYLPGELVAGIHVLDGVDYSTKITVSQALSHTSGLPCYVVDKPPHGKALMRELEEGMDSSWPIERVCERVRQIKPHFTPGERGKARYSDTNHQLLSLVIERIADTPITMVLNQLFADLEMKQTHVCEDERDSSYVSPYSKDKQPEIGRFAASTRNDIVSTAEDQMRLLEAFFRGYFYSKTEMKSLEKWNRIFFPFEYGVGIQKFSMPRLLSPFRAVPDMLGHCGSTGSVAFHIPDAGINITGTTNQLACPNVAFQTMIKIVFALS